MRNQVQRLLLAGAILFMSACTTTTTLSSARQGTVVSLREMTINTPDKKDLKSTSFTNYEFKAVDPDNQEPFYGLLPFQFRGGRLAVDILLFAPGAFLNLRTPFEFYEFDVANKVLRYKSDASETWVEYVPKPEEVARAQAYFGTQANPVPNGGSAAEAP